MKLILALLLLVCVSASAEAALSAPQVATVPVAPKNSSPVLDRKDIEAQLGRKLNLAERIVFGVAKRKARRRAREAGADGPVDALAVVSFGLGLLTVLSIFTGSGALFILFGLGAIVTGIISLVNLSGKNDYKRGRGFAIAGIATPVGTLLLLLILIALIFSAFN